VNDYRARRLPDERVRQPLGIPFGSSFEITFSLSHFGPQLNQFTKTLSKLLADQ
jgi:hypothetical protein